MYERTFSGALGPYFSQIKQIAAGGNGRILSGIDTRFDFPVCIKRISVANKDECRAALREIRIRRRLRHENIVGLLNAIISDGTDVSEISPANFRETSCIYLVQELLDADLRQVIENHSRLSDEYIKLFFYQLLRGLKYIHSANVLHRDLKPSNVMINVNSLQLMIGDFGHSMVLDPEYNHGSSLTVCNTSLWYKAPELILGTGHYSTASDIWAVGCILGEMLLARPLFEGENDLEQLELIIHAIKVPQKDQSNIRTFLTEEVNTMYSGEPKFPLRAKFQKVDCQALHLLEHLLSFNPEDRVTTELALSHPFLQEYACVADEPVCLKALHLEHEVDDFLEYTLKDLVVGECVALAEEQPRIHLQMSSFSSLTDITKDCSVSPTESASHSAEERCSAELKTFSEDYHEVSNENDCNRFKVLEVLKEEHGSSSDSNGLAVHEEGVSNAPLVLDHPMFSSSKWEKERHKSGHRRHHHHRRKKKYHMKSPSSEVEPSLDSNGGRLHEHTHESREERLPEVDVPKSETPRVHVPTLNSAEQCLSPMVYPPNPETSPLAEVPHIFINSDPLKITQEHDDKVQELIMRSRQLIADQTVDSVPALTDICRFPPSAVTAATDVCSNVALQTFSTYVYGTEPSKEISMEPMEIGDEIPVKKTFSSSVGDLSGLNHHRTAVDLGVAEVIRRSQELLGEVYRSNDEEEKSLVADGCDDVQDLILKSEQLLEIQRENASKYNLCPSEGKAVVADGCDDVQNLILKSEQLLEIQRENASKYNLCPSEEKTSLVAIDSDPVKELILRSQPNTGAKIEHSRPESTLEDNSYNYPPPFTDNPNHHMTSIHSTVKGNVDTQRTITPTFSRPVNNILQPMLNDPYRRRESSRRMEELLEDSRTLISSLNADETLSLENECGLKNEDLSEKAEGFSRTKKIQSFDQSLDGIDLKEMKLVLDQAKKLLEKPSESNERVSSCVDQSVMDVDDDAGEENDVKFTRMEICDSYKSNDVNTTEMKSDIVQAPGLYKDESSEDSLKDLSCFQNDLDFVDVVSEPAIVRRQAAVFGVVKVRAAPLLQQQTLHFNCFARSPGSESAKATEKCGDLEERTVESPSSNFQNSPFQTVLVKKRSSETTSDDNAHKHFKNSSLTSPDVNFPTATACDTVEGNVYNETGVVENRKHSLEDDSKNLSLNGILTSTLDLNADKRLKAHSNCKPDLPALKTQTENGKYSPKNDSLEHNRNTYSSRVIEQLHSDEVVDKLCGNTCRMENNAKRLNSKDTSRLQNFYATLKIKSIMRNRSRPLREKRHDTYPF